jgi:hypothetical protein
MRDSEKLMILFSSRNILVLHFSKIDKNVLRKYEKPYQVFKSETAKPIDAEDNIKDHSYMSVFYYLVTTLFNGHRLFIFGKWV